MKEQIKLFFKGFIIGIANIIPGVSGGTLAITLGIYEKLINILSNFYKNIIENIKFLIPIGLGAVIALLSLSKVINFCLNNYEVQTVFFFAGLILGGLPVLFKKAKKGKSKISSFIAFALTFSLVIVFALLKTKSNMVDLSSLNFVLGIKLFFVGSIAAATMVIPGISGSFVLMLLGFYKPIISIISDLAGFNNIIHNMLILIPFGLGLVIGIILVAKLIEYLLKKYEKQTYFGIIGFVLSSIVAIFIPVVGYSTISVIVGFLLMIVGIFISYKLGE